MPRKRDTKEGKRYDGGEIPKVSPEELREAQAKAKVEKQEEAQAEAAEKSEE